MLTVAQFALVEGLSRQYVHRLVKAGKVVAVLEGGRLMIEEGAKISRAWRSWHKLPEQTMAEKMEAFLRSEATWHHSRIRTSIRGRECSSCVQGIPAGGRYLAWKAAAGAGAQRAICWQCATLEVDGALRWSCRALDLAIAKSDVPIPVT